MMNNKAETTAALKVPMSRIRGFDAIRFVCAFWVVVHHSLDINTHGHMAGSLLWRAEQALWILSFNGNAAVMVFFVISGFAIHYPFRHGETPAWGEYFLRRYIRIGVPVVVAVTLLWFAGPVATNWENGVLWSLYAEIIYYALYPLLMIGRRRLGWRPLLALMAGAMLLVNLHFPHSKDFQENGVKFTWIIGLPVWLTGCLLAECSDALTAARVSRIWVWRISILATATLCNFLRFHSPIGQTWTLPLFTILIFFWLRQEIRQNRAKAPAEFLEKAGAWSYSLYLMHFPAFWLLHILPFSIRPIQFLTVLQLSLALMAAYVFYLFVERPSHWLARQMKQRGNKEAAPPVYERNQVE